MVHVGTAQMENIYIKLSDTLKRIHTTRITKDLLDLLDFIL